MDTKDHPESPGNHVNGRDSSARGLELSDVQELKRRLGHIHLLRESRSQGGNTKTVFQNRGGVA
jgi:hypothetical protein